MLSLMILAGYECSSQCIKKPFTYPANVDYVFFCNVATSDLHIKHESQKKPFYCLNKQNSNKYNISGLPLLRFQLIMNL